MTILASAKDKLIRKGRSGPVVREIQLALQSASQDVIADGQFGSITEQAVKRFQAVYGLEIDGVVGPKTAKLLDQVRARVNPILPDESKKASAPWLSTMRAISGTKEVPGAADSPIIMDWKEEIVRVAPDMAGYVKQYSHDSIPWCGLAVAYSMAANDIRPIDGFLWALNWGKFGRNLNKVIPGAVLTMERNGGGHVTIADGEDENYYYGRGGNQQDMVNLSKFPKSRIKHVRWPNEFPVVGTTPIARSENEAKVSTKES